MRKHLVVLGLTVLFINGCAEVSPILKANESKSFFEGAVYSGQSTTVNTDTTGEEQYRLFQQGASSFVPLDMITEESTLRAKEYCEQQGKSLKLLQKTLSNPPHILGNFPRVELLFTCTILAPTVMDDLLYTRLTNLKKLLDNGTLTKEEFEAQKAKILNP